LRLRHLSLDSLGMDCPSNRCMSLCYSVTLMIHEEGLEMISPRKLSAGFCLVVSGVVLVLTNAHVDATGPSPLPAEDVVPVENSMHEFMEYVFQPTYLRLKQSMATAPADNKGWKAIKSDSLILAESCNLLFSRKPAEHAEDWIRHAKSSKELGGKLYSAARAKDFAAATESYKAMLESCNSCHRQFEDGKHILMP